MKVHPILLNLCPSIVAVSGNHSRARQEAIRTSSVGIKFFSVPKYAWYRRPSKVEIRNQHSHRRCGKFMSPGKHRSRIRIDGPSKKDWLCRSNTLNSRSPCRPDPSAAASAAYPALRACAVSPIYHCWIHLDVARRVHHCVVGLRN
jgi:hypothetical protein